MAGMWRALAIVHVDGARNKHEAVSTAAVSTMAALTADERFSGLSPNDVLCNYMYYVVLHKTNADEVNKSTALSIAFNKLQARANRIDDLEIKRSFFSKQVWNAALFSAARERKFLGGGVVQAAFRKRPLVSFFDLW
jgi:hypothetical protein